MEKALTNKDLMRLIVWSSIPENLKLAEEKKKEKTKNEKRLAGIILSSTSETELVERLVEGEKRFSELKDTLDWSSGRLHYHILRLRANGIVSRRPSGYGLTEKGKKIAKKYL